MTRLFLFETSAESAKVAGLEESRSDVLPLIVFELVLEIVL